MAAEENVEELNVEDVAELERLWFQLDEDGMRDEALAADMAELHLAITSHQQQRQNALMLDDSSRYDDSYIEIDDADFAHNANATPVEPGHFSPQTHISSNHGTHRRRSRHARKAEKSKATGMFSSPTHRQPHDGDNENVGSSSSRPAKLTREQKRAARLERKHRRRLEWYRQRREREEQELAGGEGLQGSEAEPSEEASSERLLEAHRQLPAARRESEAQRQLEAQCQVSDAQRRQLVEYQMAISSPWNVPGDILQEWNNLAWQKWDGTQEAIPEMLPVAKPSSSSSAQEKAKGKELDNTVNMELSDRVKGMNLETPPNNRF